MGEINLLIVDDHPLFLKGLKSFLQKDQEIANVFTADTYASAFKLCEKNKIDIILMDIHLGKVSGVELTRKIKTNFPNIKVIGFSASNDDQIIRKMMDAKANGFVIKDTDIDELKVAINIVSDGKFYFSSSISRQTYSNTNGTTFRTSRVDGTKNKLTYREAEILGYIIEEELSNKEIAARLFISPRTVETHKRNLIQKLDVRNVVGLVKFYFKNGNWLKENIREIRSLNQGFH